MEATLLNLFREYGISGLIIGYLLWDKFIKPLDRKKRGEWVSFKDIEHHKKRLEHLEDRFGDHLQKEAEEDVRMGKMETDQMYNREELKHVYNHISSMWSKFENVERDLKQILIMMSELRQRNI